MRRGWWLMAMFLAHAAAADTRALIVAGLGGTDDYETAFQRQAKACADALREVSDDVTLLLGEMAAAERLAGELAALGARAESSDTLLLVLVGHGSFDERDYRFNVPGPDVTGTQLQNWLDGMPAARQLVIAATSASGALQDLLAADTRMLVTATRSGGERNASGFGRYLIEALEDVTADTDKDGYVGAGEAFDYAESQLTAFYAARQEMATEHPLRSGPELNVALARLPDAYARAARVDSATAGRLDELEAAVDALRARKSDLPADEYFAELQRLLLELAMVRDSGGVR